MNRIAQRGKKMVKLTKAQRIAVYRIYNRTEKTVPYREFRKTVQPGYDCVMLPVFSMWLGIEPDGYTHS